MLFRRLMEMALMADISEITNVKPAPEPASRTHVIKPRRSPHRMLVVALRFRKIYSVILVLIAWELTASAINDPLFLPRLSTVFVTLWSSGGERSIGDRRSSEFVSYAWWICDRHDTRGPARYHDGPI